MLTKPTHIFRWPSLVLEKGCKFERLSKRYQFDFFTYLCKKLSSQGKFDFMIIKIWFRRDYVSSLPTSLNGQDKVQVWCCDWSRLTHLIWILKKWCKKFHRSKNLSLYELLSVAIHIHCIRQRIPHSMSIVDQLLHNWQIISSNRKYVIFVYVQFNVSSLPTEKSPNWVTIFSSHFITFANKLDETIRFLYNFLSNWNGASIWNFQISITDEVFQFAPIFFNLT